jgi:N-acetylmuramoyl-L-alanine amidase
MCKASSFWICQLTGFLIATSSYAEQPLFVAYPPNNHETTSDKIFLIGTAPKSGVVLVNGKSIERSQAGHFAPSFPLQIGENQFKLHYQNQSLQIKVTRKSTAPRLPTGNAFVQSSLQPAVTIARLPGEWICFQAIAPEKATVTVQVNNRSLPLSSRQQQAELPPNSAILTQQNQPTQQALAGHYEGCLQAQTPGNLGQPEFQLTAEAETVRKKAPGSITILDPAQLQTAEVIVNSGVARTGPSSDYSRLTPLPKGTQATITGQEGDWTRLEYGGWIKTEELKISSSTKPIRSRIRSVTSRQMQGWTEVIFPLEVPVPITIAQAQSTVTLTLHNTTAQTDTIKLSDDPLIERLDWQQTSPDRIEYQFWLKTKQQWGYKLRYEGTSLILSLRHPPKLAARSSDQQSLKGMTILLDPGHGSQNDLGARGPNGYPEKDVTLKLSQQVQAELIRRGANVVMTRQGDDDLLPNDRVKQIETVEPTIALSLHYNALPDSGDALKTQGLSTFWYNPQAHSLAMFLHNYLVQTLDRPSYGVFWNNLALTRPTVSPSVMLELGFMIHPEEFEWIINEQEQQKLAQAIAAGIVEWTQSQR